MDCVGLALEWEGSADVRALVREHGVLLKKGDGQKFVEPSRANCVQNAAVLKPALHRLRESPGWKLPSLPYLQREIAMLLDKLGIVSGTTAVYQPSVELKKLLGVVKRRAGRKEVTKD